MNAERRSQLFRKANGEEGIVCEMDLREALQELASVECDLTAAEKERDEALAKLKAAATGDGKTHSDPTSTVEARARLSSHDPSEVVSEAIHCALSKKGGA